MSTLYHPNAARRPALGGPFEQPDGSKMYACRGDKFYVDGRYHLSKVLGVGAMGTVCAATDAEQPDSDGNPGAVAIKVMTNIFRHIADGKRILRELKLMRFLRHENLLELYTIMKPSPNRSIGELYMVTRMMGTSLRDIILTQHAGLTDEHFQYFTWQAFSGLAYMHSANVMHRDLKPENLLVNGDCELVICDFGLARGFKEGDMTNYVVTRYYRPPEVLVADSQYTPAVDIWSLALILGELVNGRVLLQGADYISQLLWAVDLVGTPEPEEMYALTDEVKGFLLAQTPRPRRDFQEVFPKATPECIDLLNKCLVFDFKKRMTAHEALRHPYFKSYHDDEIKLSEKRFDWAQDSDTLTPEELRDGLWEEMGHHHPELAGTTPPEIPKEEIYEEGEDEDEQEGENGQREQKENSSHLPVQVVAPTNAAPSAIVYSESADASISAIDGNGVPDPAPAVATPSSTDNASVASVAQPSESVAESRPAGEQTGPLLNGEQVKAVAEKPAASQESNPHASSSNTDERRPSASPGVAAHTDGVGSEPPIVEPSTDKKSEAGGPTVITIVAVAAAAIAAGCLLRRFVL